MSFNPSENALLTDAISKLEAQLIELGEWNPQQKNKLYLGGKYSFMLVKNKLTIAKEINGSFDPRDDIVPVNCYNIYKSMCMADAVSEFFDRQENPEKYNTPFFV